MFRYRSQLQFKFILKVDKKILKEIEGLVDEILKIKSKNSNEDVSEIEGEIDKIVYELYDLTEEEVGIVEVRSK